MAFEALSLGPGHLPIEVCIKSESGLGAVHWNQAGKRRSGLRNSVPGSFGLWTLGLDAPSVYAAGVLGRVRILVGSPVRM